MTAENMCAHAPTAGRQARHDEGENGARQPGDENGAENTQGTPPVIEGGNAALPWCACVVGTVAPIFTTPWGS
jgi:hypothetical protein